MRAQRLALCLGAVSISFLPTPLSAEEGRVDQVEGLEIEAEAAELELQFILAEEEDARLLIGTFEYGLSEWLQLGVEIESESEDGEALRVESIAPQAKVVFADPASATVGFGLQAGAVIDTEGEGIGAELALIAEHRREDFALIANLIAEAEPGDWSEGSLSYAARGDWELGDTIGAGVEFGGALTGESKGSHFAGPVLDLGLAEDGPSIELGVFAPLSEEAPGWQARLELDWEF